MSHGIYAPKSIDGEVRTLMLDGSRFTPCLSVKLATGKP